MKRVIGFLMCICLLIGICPINTLASELEIKYLKVSVEGKEQVYECLCDGEEIYCSIENLSNITKYDWTQIEDRQEFQFYREYEDDNREYGIELRTSVLIKISENEKTAEIDAMGEVYSVKCCVSEGKVFLPLEKLLYLLHAEWRIENDVVCVMPMPLTILDFMAIHNVELAQIESRPEDVLIDTGWLFSDNKWGQAVYSTIAEVFSDFDGKIFMIWWPEEGHVKTAECYERAILQLAKEDKEFVGEEVQSDAMKKILDSIFFANNKYVNKIQNSISIPSNIDDIVQSVPDAVSVLRDLSEKFPKVKVSEKIKNVSNKIERGEINSSFLETPELKSKAKELGKIGDGLAILQCVWNAYDTVDRIEGWDKEYLNQLEILANYRKSSSVNESVLDYVQSSAQRLIDSYDNPTQAALNEVLQNTMGLLFSKTFDESPFGKTFSIMGTVGNCCGIFNEKIEKTYEVYSELNVVTFSIKIEQLVRELFRYEDILTTTDKLTSDGIEEARNQLMLYLRLNLRNKAQLYNLNIKGNNDKAWSESEEAKELYNEIVKVYSMIAELIQSKDYDSRIILTDNLEEISFQSPRIFKEILSDSDEKTEYELKRTLENCTSDSVLGFEYDDYDGDGTNEAYGFTSPNAYDEWGICGNVDVWFIDSDGNCMLLLEDLYGYLHTQKLVIGRRKFLVWEKSAGGSGSLSFVFGVKNKQAYEPDVSRKYMCFGFDMETGVCNNGIFYGYISDSSKGYHDYIPVEFIFDLESGEFIEK